MKVDENSTCAIRHGSDLSELIKQTKLIIWDEAPMQNRYAFECLDKSLREIMRYVNSDIGSKPFGGIPILLGGDFRQILPVISRGSRSDIVAASICRSYLWSICEVFQLKVNMRLSVGKSEEEQRSITSFSKWILDVGDGKVENANRSNVTSEFAITIPDQFLVHSNPSNLHDMIERVYPKLEESFFDVKYLRQRAILTPKNTVVDHLNSIILDKIPGECVEYRSVDYMDVSCGHDENLSSTFPVEYLNGIKLPGMPPHKLSLKVGVVVMLLRNLN